MSFSFLTHWRSSSRSRSDEAVARDADALIIEWGDAAFDRATYLSWEEDFGIVVAPAAGHWWRVREEVARRVDRHEASPPAVHVA